MGTNSSATIGDLPIELMLLILRHGKTYRLMNRLAQTCRGFYKHGREDTARHALKHLTPLRKTTPMFIAARHGHDGIVRLLLETESVNIIARDRKGRTALEVAVWSGHSAVVKQLVDAGADTEARYTRARIRSGDGASLLIEAATNYHWDVMKYLLESDRVDAMETGTYMADPLELAISKGQGEIVRLLLNGGRGLENGIGYDKLRPLHCAVEEKHPAVVKLLLEMGAEPNIPRSKIDTPIFATING
ncbi:ankyrin repeat-containing domain protein [Aspergillus venezuelensis]